MSDTENTGTDSPDESPNTAGETAGGMTVEELRDWLREWVATTTGLSVEQISVDRPMEEFGLASRDAVALAADVEDRTGVILTATAAYNHPTIAMLAKRIIEGDPDEGLDVDADRFWERERNADDDIAIVGLATRFPKAGETPESTWEALINGVDGITDLPEDRWTEFKADPRLAEIIAEANVHGGYLDDVVGFDADFFQMSPREVEMVDPQQRLALELTWEALENAHLPASDLKGEPVGVFLGTSTNDYQMLATLGLGEGASETAAYALTGTASSIIANRVSYFYDFRGPSLSIDTACSSSLVAVHQAVRSLRTGETDVAIAGGVNMIITPAVTLGFDSIGAQAPDGRIKAFSSDANGMIRAEGGGVFVLKRLSAARADGDQILAVIAGSAVNSDGRSNGIFAPNPEAQVNVLRDAYADAAIDPRTVDYIEAHGTGTVLGDPIEADALGRVVGRGRTPDRPALLGSAKTNYGHMESAAGAGALAKVVLALQHDKIPASLNYVGPNPYIQFEATNLRVTAENTDWPRYSGHAVAGLSGFGFGGTNAHVVVREVLPSDLAADGDGDSSVVGGSLGDESAVVGGRVAGEDGAGVGGEDGAGVGGRVAGEDGAGVGGRVVGDEGADVSRPSRPTAPETDEDDDEYLTDAERALLAAQATTAETVAPAVETDPAEGFAPCAAPDAVVPLVISGFLPSRRRKAAAELAEWLASDEGRATPLAEIGRALARRNHGRTRSVVMARSHEDALKGVQAVAAGKALPFVYTADSPDAASAVWLLSGFGSQHRKMAKQLYLENPVFAKHVDRVDVCVQNELGYSISELFLDDSQTYGIETSQVGIYTIQVALADTMRHYGAEPGVLVPHSMGEASAAYISGGLSLEDATRVICQRSRLMGEGESMLAGDDIRLMAIVEYSADDITAVLDDYPDLEICVYAAPTHTVIGGPESQVDAIVDRAEAEGKLGRKLQTKGASHTSQMDPLLGELAYELTGLDPQRPKVGFYSSVDREVFYRPGAEPVHTIEYFTKGLRHSVWFAQAIAKTVENGHRTFVELSPNPAVLISVAASAFGAGIHNAELVETLRRKEDESYGLINALMKLWVHGHPVDVGSLFGTGQELPYANIPRTRFDRKPYWLTASVSSSPGSSAVPGAHVALPDGRHAWEVTVNAVSDPRELVLAAARQVLDEPAVAAVDATGEFPREGTVTTVFTRHPGGGAVAVYADGDHGHRLVFEAAVTSSRPSERSVSSDAGPSSNISDETPSDLANSGFGGGPVVDEDEVVDDIGRKFEPGQGETVEQRLAVIVGESMGYDPDDLPREIPLIELGLDSLMAVRIKNRVEYEFDIPQLQLQAMRQANLMDVTKFVTFAVENRDQVDVLAQGAADGQELDTAALSALIDEVNARKAAEPTPRQAQGATDDAEEPGSESAPSAGEPLESEGGPQESEGAPTSTVEPVRSPSTELRMNSATSRVETTPQKADLTDQAEVAAAAGTDVPPRDAPERLTFGAYAVVTGKSAGGVFNKLPVLDDETAQKLTDRLNERTGGDIDVEDVLAAETIEEMSDYVRKHMDAAADIDGFVRYLRVPTVAGSAASGTNQTQKDGTRQHLFDTTAGDPTPMLVFHPAGGNTSAYEALLKRLPEDQPVVGFDRVEGTIEERVRQYLPKLREVQPHGPYILVGWSLGGALAYGAAQLLSEQGEEVAFVGLIDVVRPREDVVETPETKRARLERWRDFAVKTYDLDADTPIPMDRLVEADDDEQFAIIMEMIQMSGTKIPGGIIEHQRTSFLDNRALTNIDPSRYDGKVVLYRADKMHDGAIELEPQWAEIDEDGRWGEVVDDLEIVYIGGDHLSIVDEPYVSKVAADLSKRIADLNENGAGA